MTDFVSFPRNEKGEIIATPQDIVSDNKTRACLSFVKLIVYAVQTILMALIGSRVV